MKRINKNLRHIAYWISRRVIILFALLLLVVAAMVIWFFATGSSQSPTIVAIGIAAISAFFAALSAIASLLQATEAQKLREIQERPYVLGFFEGTKKGAIYFLVENRGNSPAIDVSIFFDPAPVDYSGKLLNEVSIFQKPISFLAPGKNFRQIVDVGHRFLADGKPTYFRSTIQYSSVFGELFKETTEHDLAFMKQATLPIKSVEESLEDIEKHMKDLYGLLSGVRGGNSLLVQTPDQFYGQMMNNRDQENYPKWRKWLRNLLEKLLDKLE